MMYVFLLLLSFSLTYFIKNYSIKNSLIDMPNDRSSHIIPTPHGGGIAIAITWFVGLSYLFYTNEMESSLYYALMVGAVLAVISYLDDLYGLSPKIRLLMQSSVAIGGIVVLGGLHDLDFGFFSTENQIFTNIFAFLLIVWFVNLYNFLDGINGYAGSETVFLSLAGFVLFGGSYFLVLTVAVIGFLCWNWGTAKIFMGDVGSTLLGYNVAIFTIYYANQKSENLWVWIILFGVFWFDATLTLLRRKQNGEKLSLAHKKHAYQRLNQSGWAHDKVTLVAMGINLILLGLVYFISNIFIAFIVAIILLYAIVRFVDSQKTF